MPVVVSAGLQQGSLTDAWCYNAPAVRAIGGNHTNGPTSGSVSVTLSGSLFGRQGFSSQGRIGRASSFDSDMTGGSACEASTWRSDSSTLCKVSAGSGGGWPMRRGRGMPVVVSAGLQQGSLTDAWCYNSPLLTSVFQSFNGPSTGSVVVTVSGLTLSAFGVSAGALIGRHSTGHVNIIAGSSSISNLWVSDSTVTCKHSSGT